MRPSRNKITSTAARSSAQLIPPNAAALLGGGWQRRPGDNHFGAWEREDDEMRLEY
jgi:hypothetical protein